MSRLAALERLRDPAAVVLGLGQNGLATVRALGRRGVPVIGVDARLEQPGARSRYCLPVRCEDFRSGGAGLIAALRTIGERLAHKAVLFPSGDLNLRAVSEHREALAPYFLIALPDKATVRLILDKRPFYDFARDAGFRIPATVALEPSTVSEVAAGLRYPVILKPALRDVAWRKEDAAKAYEVDSPSALLAEYARLAPLSSAILAQELVRGPDSALCFSLTYLDDDSTPLAMFTGRKLRQFPPRFGTSSFAESRWDPAVAEVSVALLRALRYRGYASVEFKRDAVDGQLNVIEVTGRTWYPHGLSTHCGVNLPFLAYCHLLRRPLPAPGVVEDGVKWIDEERDIRSALAERRAGRLSIAAWLASYRGRRTWALAALDDPGPAMHRLVRLTASAAGRLRGSRGRTDATRPAVAGHTKEAAR